MIRLLLVTTLLLTATAAHALPAQVLLIRHGEKPDEGNELSAKGWLRAKALPQLFHRAEFSRNGAPAVVFAQKPKSDGGQSRPFHTLQFVASEFHLTVDVDFARDDVDGITHDVLKNPAYNGKFVVICWEHKVLEDIAAALGVQPKPNYPKEHFDRAWLLTYSGKDATPKFEDLPEHLLPGDSDN
jgi:hypothetical protein